MITLGSAPLGVPLTVADNDAEGSVAQRLARIGIRAGAAITVVSRTAGGGRVVSIAGARVALGDAVLDRVTVREHRA